MTNYNEAFKGIDAGKVLDVATGGGTFLKLFLDGVKSYDEAVGIDVKESAAEPFSAAFQGNGKVNFKVMDASDLEFPEESFDTVCISNSLHHLAHPADILVEMKRVLRTGGWFIINEMYRDGDQAETQQTHILLHHWLAAVDSLNGVVHNETYRRGQLIDFATGLGLQEIKVFDVADLGDDPHDPEIVSEYEPIIDRYIQRAGGHPDLQKYGETMRSRLKSVGYHSATALLLIATR